MVGKKVRSAKGQVVDFDLLAIKEQIASDPAPLDVQARQDHIDQRLRRRIRKVKKNTPPVSPVAVQPQLPAAERAEQPEPLIDEKLNQTSSASSTVPPVTKQKARTTKKTRTTT